MKSILTILFLIPVFLFAQGPKMSVESKSEINSLKQDVRKINIEYKLYSQKYPLIKINDEVYVSFVGKLKPGYTDSADESVLIGEGVGRIRSVRVKLSDLDKISSLDQLKYLEIAGKIQSHLDKVPYDTRVDSVHRGLTLPQPYTGKDVIIGVQDWGFDYTHPMFYDTLLENSRILAAWDQWKIGGNKPEGLTYGAEYVNWEELSTAQSDTSNQYGYGTHATHVAGIAGGSGAGFIDKGMAFESEFLFSTILLDEAAAIDSWNWMLDKAQFYQKNLVVNMSWGLYNIGTSDGTSLMSQAIEELTDEGVLFVSSAGNNGNVNFHIQHEFNEDTIKSKIQFDSYAAIDSLYGQRLHGWGTVGQNFEVNLEILSSSLALLGESSYISTALNDYQEGMIIVNNDADTIFYKVTAEEAHPQSGRPYVHYRIKNTNSNLHVVMSAAAESGTVHFWNVTDLNYGGGNWGMPFVKLGNDFIGGDNLYGIGEPTSADDCISVASHAASYVSSQGNVLGGKRSSFSSIGPRNDGEMKPNISGPGGNVLSSLSSFSSEGQNSSMKVTFNGREYGFARLSGTSMSSPVVAGISALIWEANPYLSPRQIKQIIEETAREDVRTGVLPEGGNTLWGHGKVNALDAIRSATGVVGTESYELDNHKWSVYPNPTSSVLSVKGFDRLQDVKLIDLMGKVVDLDATKDIWDVGGMARGVYVFRVVVEDKVYQKKVVIN